jgi:hypothetical protein
VSIFVLLSVMRLSFIDICSLFRFFERVDRALRRSLGVPETAQADASVVPAPPKAETPLTPVVEPSMNPNDFIEMKDFKESLKQSKKDGTDQKVFDAAKVREEVDRLVKKHTEL